MKNKVFFHFYPCPAFSLYVTVPRSWSKWIDAAGDTVRHLLGDGIFGADDKVWRRQRKAASLEFHSAEFRAPTASSLVELVHHRLLPCWPTRMHDEDGPAPPLCSVAIALGSPSGGGSRVAIAVTGRLPLGEAHGYGGGQGNAAAAACAPAVCRTTAMALRALCRHDVRAGSELRQRPGLGGPVRVRQSAYDR